MTDEIEKKLNHINFENPLNERLIYLFNSFIWKEIPELEHNQGFVDAIVQTLKQQKIESGILFDEENIEMLQYRMFLSKAINNFSLLNGRTGRVNVKDFLREVQRFIVKKSEMEM